MTNLPKTSTPAERALATIKVFKLEDLTRYTEKEILSLHGMGPKAIRILKEALKKQGKAFKQISR